MEEVSLDELGSQGAAFYQIEAGNVGDVPNPTAEWGEGDLDTKSEVTGYYSAVIAGSAAVPVSRAYADPTGIGGGESLVKVL